jgi:chloramphenicol 3-O-phosphotransferase
MNIYDDEGDARAGLEHDGAVLLTERRLQKQLAALAGQYPDHLISTESYPGRGRRFVARARAGTAARPWLVLTPDLDELRAALPSRRRA